MNGQTPEHSSAIKARQNIAAVCPQGNQPTSPSFSTSLRNSHALARFMYLFVRRLMYVGDLVPFWPVKSLFQPQIFFTPLFHLWCKIHEEEKGLPDLPPTPYRLLPLLWKHSALSFWDCCGTQWRNSGKNADLIFCSEKSGYLDIVEDPRLDFEIQTSRVREEISTRRFGEETELLGGEKGDFPLIGFT